MKTTIYDYDNKPHEVELKDDAIKYIMVTVISGDEVIEVYYKDGSCEKFDSSNNRQIDYFDGVYLVSEEDIKKWLNFEFSGIRTNSYERQIYFELRRQSNG